MLGEKSMNEKRLQQQLRTFDRILETYDAKVPLSRFFTQYFKENRQMGATDRRIASRLVYTFYRLGKALPDFSSHERLAVSEFLCVGESDFAKFIAPSQLGSGSSLNLSERVDLSREKFGFELESIFPVADKISPRIDKKKFLLSHFIQPDLFIRIHLGREEAVTRALERSSISFKELGNNAVSLPNGTKLDKIESLAGNYEVQDLSSQRTGRLFKPAANESWWDACAGSGGKSMLLLQQEPAVKLLVSDNRSSILRNLDERFDLAGITDYRKKIIDLAKEETLLKDEQFDGIILDAPCTGSGTWGRTPEMMTNFDSSQLPYFTALQKQLALHALRQLKVGKPLIYITCSVFEEENEQVVELLEREGVQVEEMSYFKGYEERADTLFAARLIR